MGKTSQKEKRDFNYSILVIESDRRHNFKQPIKHKTKHSGRVILSYGAMVFISDCVVKTGQFYSSQEESL